MCSGSGVRRRQREVAAIEEGFSSEGGGSLTERRGAWRSWVGRGGTDNEGIHRWDLDQKLMGGNWEQS
jgi:hypothetical protein